MLRVNSKEFPVFKGFVILPCAHPNAVTSFAIVEGILRAFENAGMRICALFLPLSTRQDILS